MALMGGVAVAVWKHLRTTHDVDVLIGLNHLSPDELLKLLQGHGFHPKRFPAMVQVGEHRFFQLLYEPKDAFMDIQVDLLLADSEYQLEALSRRVPRRITNLDCETFVLSCEDLILHKLLAGRVIDRADCAYLVRFNKPDLDFAYLKKWVPKLGLELLWREIWDEACPGEASPI
jgi:hypothetical protein